ncbi:MAG: DUF1801 domain-containing protein [Lunatimonas sp.]|uniref:DUF1801 domain-containing protein n=1 Tax=Lunatimonas sp. TaxID=2060141 RepID=UPI00263B17E5|nr:DUF1801 domain-containing protein [Lunatimonas sp.]MCC5935758.1 DUF1801 domain-containing protein [Lunatimonas sp.]
MSKQKNQETGQDVLNYIADVPSTQKQADSLQLIQWMEQITGHPAKMWGPSIIGFGKYHYKYTSGHEGFAPLVGFSPRKKAMSLYVFTGLEKHLHYLNGLGKYTMGKACIYVKQLSDIDESVLKNLIQQTIRFQETRYGRV